MSSAHLAQVIRAWAAAGAAAALAAAVVLDDSLIMPSQAAGFFFAYVLATQWRERQLSETD
ncbi:hypothetical protein [Arthrobacter sp. IK3]|uniref:hypothetical protein n=1 Tax=Arthrobacter sp. IK3 TaxID=3448169 RepID=UPI003EDFC68E